MAALVAGPSSLALSNNNNAVGFYSSRSVRRSQSLSSSAAMATNTLRSVPVQRKSVASGGDQQFSTIRSVSVSDVGVYTAVDSDLPLKEIPGTYGLPFFGAIKDRLDFHWNQGVPKFYEARRDKYKSTVYRTNVPPGPPFYPDPRVVVLLDQKSFPILFDVSKVEKKDIFTGTYMPSLDFTGGYRVLAYLDPSEPKHAAFKQFTFESLKTMGPRVFPSFTSALSEVYTKWDATLAKDGKVAFATDLPAGTFKSVCTAFTGRDPTLEGENSLGSGGSTNILIWIFSQLLPITPIPAPWYLAPFVELFLHTFKIPAVIIKWFFYGKMVKFFKTYGTELLDLAEKKLNLDRDEALHNLVFNACFNFWGGVYIFFPEILKRLGATSLEFQAELAAEVRKAVADNGGTLSPKALEAMPLVQSAVYEVLRIDPPVPYQYAKAKEDLVIESHEAKFQIKKGETLAGYMPITCRDPKIFEDPETFVPKRFVGDEGKALLKYVLWSNGPQTEEPSLSNKHCPGKNIVLTVAHLFVATLYTKYDSLQVDAANSSVFTSLKQASS